MALSNSQYDAIMREYGKQQMENQHSQEARKKEIYQKVPAVKELEAEIAERSVACARKLLEGNQEAIYELREKLADLKEQKALLIKAAGYSDDYLELHYRCKDCRDTGWVDGHKCHCFLRAQMKLLYAQSNLERVLEQENFDHLTFQYYDNSQIIPEIGMTNADYMRRVVKSCMEFAQNFDSHQDNLLFTGSTGVGKTFLTNCIARKLMVGAMEELRRQGFKSVHILVAKENKKALASYKVFEYETVGECFLHEHDYWCYEKAL